MVGFAESLVQVLTGQARQMEATRNPAQGLEGKNNNMALNNQQMLPPPFTKSSNLLATGRYLAGQQVSTFQQVGSSNDQVQLLLQALHSSWHRPRGGEQRRKVSGGGQWEEIDNFSCDFKQHLWTKQ